MKLNEKIKITEERLNSDERSYERVIMAFLVGSHKAAPGYRMEIMSSRETGYDVFAVEVNVYMPRQKTAYTAFYIELNSMNIQPAGTQNEPKMIYYRGTFEEYKENEYKAYCAAADFMGRMEQPAPEAETPDAPQEDKQDTDEERIDALFHELVPVEGKADTVAGEIVRTVCRIGYRYDNDGDYLGCGYGKETCNPAARYLIANAGEDVAEIVRCLWAAGEECGVLDDGSYDDWLSELVKATLAYLDEHPELKTTPNAEDYWNYRDPVEDVDEWDDEDEDEWDAA